MLLITNNSIFIYGKRNFTQEGSEEAKEGKGRQEEVGNTWCTKTKAAPTGRLLFLIAQRLRVLDELYVYSVLSLW